MKNLTVIVNPAAGRGRAKKVFSLVAHFLEKLKMDFRAVFSEGPGHIVELAREASDKGSDAVVACGGDGTVHEVITGIDGRPTAVGLIPCGTGDDLAVNLGIPNDPRQACLTLARGEIRRFDIAKADGRPYACIAGAGFDSMVNRRANEGARWLRGTSVYIYSVFRTLATFKPVEMTVETDGILHAARVMFVVVANAPSYGGGMRIAPMARMDDGLLDVIIIGELPKTELVRVFPKVFSGRHIDHPCVMHLRAARAALSSPRRLELFGDGEFMQNLPVTIEAVPGALPVIVPASTPPPAG